MSKSYHVNNTGEFYDIHLVDSNKSEDEDIFLGSASTEEEAWEIAERHKKNNM